MKYYKYLYLGEGIKNPTKLKAKLKLHKGVIGVYVIALSMGNDQLDIMSAYYLKLKYYRKHPPIIIGLAKSYDEAVDIIIKIINESLEKTGKTDIKEYLKLKVKTQNFS